LAQDKGGPSDAACSWLTVWLTGQRFDGHALLCSGEYVLDQGVGSGAHASIRPNCL
jgi:hypothetical protein